MKFSSFRLFRSAVLVAVLFRQICVVAQVTNTTGFQEVFHFDLGEYWCENHLAVADFDGDGRKDIALMLTGLRSLDGPPWTYKCRAILLHNEGDGTFTDSIIADFPDFHYGYFAAAADLNGDGKPDLVLRESSASHVLLNDGSGRAFIEVTTFQPGYYALAVVDVNHDGFPDLVSGSQTSTGAVIELLVNDGTGRSFLKSWSRRYGVASDAIETVLVANLNGDGFPDIAAREIYSGLLITLHGTGGTDWFMQRNLLSLVDRTFALAGGNVNKDSLTDLAVHVGWGLVRVFVTQEDGSLAETWQSPDLGEAAFNLALADFDQDGFDDVFVGTFGDGKLRIFRNNQIGGFDLSWQGSVPGEGYTGTVADLNDDGSPDLIVGEMHGIRLLLNRVGTPRMRRVILSQGSPLIEWSSVPGQKYRVQCKDRLDDAGWSDLSGDVIAAGFSTFKLDTNPILGNQRFYRVMKVTQE
jgi:hypothetical protein